MFSRMLRRRVPVLKLGWEVTKRCAVSAKRPQSVRKAAASVREWRITRAVKGELHRTRADAAFRGVPNPSS